MFNLTQNGNIMNSMYFSIIIFIAVCFFILSIVLVFRNIVSQEKLKIQSEEINNLNQLYRKKCKELLDTSEIEQKLRLLSRPYSDKQEFPEQKIKELLKCAQLCGKDWDKIRQYINDTQNQFVWKLINKYPTLSHEDINFILLMRLNVSNVQIAAFYNIQLSSLATKRYRLMKKMRLKSDTSIVEFINNLFNDEPKSFLSVYDTTS